MSTALAIPDPSDLATWGDRKLDNAIQRGHSVAGAHMRGYEEAATVTGILLRERKSRLAHGEWGPWLAENFDGSQQTAAAYMRMAPEIESPLSISPPADAIESDAEEVETTPLPPEPKPRADDPPMMYMPDVVSDDADDNLRTQAVHWYEQGRRLQRLLDSHAVALPKSASDRDALTRDADLMITVADRLKEAIRGS